MYQTIPYDELMHYGVIGMKWGIRRYQPYSVTGPRKGGKTGKEIGQARGVNKRLYKSNKAQLKRAYKEQQAEAIDKVEKYRNKLLYRAAKKTDKEKYKVANKATRIAEKQYDEKDQDAKVKEGINRMKDIDKAQTKMANNIMNMPYEQVKQLRKDEITKKVAVATSILGTASVAARYANVGKQIFNAYQAASVANDAHNAQLISNLFNQNIDNPQWNNYSSTNSNKPPTSNNKPSNQHMWQSMGNLLTTYANATNQALQNPTQYLGTGVANLANAARKRKKKPGAVANPITLGEPTHTGDNYIPNAIAQQYDLTPNLAWDLTPNTGVLKKKKR